MAAGLGFKTFTTGEVLTAADVNGYLMQGVLVFATEAARNSAITSPQEGQFAFTKDTNSLWYYSGSAWVASGATGDIEGVTAGTGISGGGTSGTVTITNSMATAIDAKGDLVVGTGADAFSRLAVGANGTVLTADSAEATGLKWAAAAGGGKVLQIVQDVSTTQESTTSATYVDTNLSIAITPSAATSKILCILAAPVRSANTTSTTSVLSYYNIVRTSTEIAATNISYEGPTGSLALHGSASIVYLDSPSTTSATTYKVQMRRAVTNNTTFMAVESQTATLTLIEIGA